MLRKLIVLISLVLVLSACASAQASDTDLELKDLESAPTETMAPVESVTQDSDATEMSAEDITATLRPGVLQELGLAADTPLELVSRESVTWPDASLGCPEPDMMYAQVMTPGYKITFSHNGEEIEVHTSGNFGKFVMCGDESGESSVLEPAEDREMSPNLASASDHPAVQVALEELTNELGLAALDAELVEVTAQEWPNSCLGCAGAGEMCLSVITPGYKVLLSYDGQIHEYHTGRNDAARLCEVTRE